jgi:hypothetical protein
MSDHVTYGSNSYYLEGWYTAGELMEILKKGNLRSRALSESMKETLNQKPESAVIVSNRDA